MLSRKEKSMLVQQKHVTIVNMQDDPPREFVLRREANGYRLTAISESEVVNLLLSEGVVQHLRQELTKSGGHPMLEECITAVKPGGYTVKEADWLSFN
jgi:hypothetical protein